MKPLLWRVGKGLCLCLLILLIIFLYYFGRYLIPFKTTLEPGQVAAIYKRFDGGTQSKTVTEPEFYTAGWNEVNVYDLTPAPVEHSIDVLSQAGIPCEIQYKVEWVLNSDDVWSVHKNVGPDYVEVILIPEINSALRRGQTPKISLDNLPQTSQWFQSVNIQIMQNGCED